ncbi:MAG: primosomal protein, partial [Pseudomonadota bacterium]
MVEIAVLLPTPAYSRLSGPLSYSHSQALQAGQLVRVPLGQRHSLGLVWHPPTTPAPQAMALKPVEQV